MVDSIVVVVAVVVAMMVVVVIDRQIPITYLFAINCIERYKVDDWVLLVEEKKKLKQRLPLQPLPVSI